MERLVKFIKDAGVRMMLPLRYEFVYENVFVHIR